MINDSNLILKIKNKYPKLYIREIIDDKLVFNEEKDYGFVEYKRILTDFDEKRAQKYATQMRWRILQNSKNQCATYYIGVDDDGTITGLTESEIEECIKNIVLVATTINASIVDVKIVHIKELTIVKIIIKNKKISDNYLFEFDDNV